MTSFFYPLLLYVGHSKARGNKIQGEEPPQCNRQDKPFFSALWRQTGVLEVLVASVIAVGIRTNTGPLNFSGRFGELLVKVRVSANGDMWRGGWDVE